MLTISVILFAAAAVLGLIIITALLKNNPTPKAAVYTHGLLAVLGLLLLIIYVGSSEGDSPIASLILFVIAAIGGFILFARDLSQKPGPKALALIHAAAAVTAFLILLIFVFRS